MKQSNVMAKIEVAEGTINPRYSISMDEAKEIIENSTGPYSVANNAFAFGYMQGIKAERARIRKNEKNLSPYIRGIIEDCKSLDEKMLRRIRIIVGTVKGA